MALKRILLFIAVAFLCLEVIAALSLYKRSLASNASANNEGTSEEKEVCQGRTPCGWAVYDRMTRYIDYFMRNKCECSKEKKCLRDDDDISITAYVYRCKIDDSEKGTS